MKKLKVLFSCCFSLLLVCTAIPTFATISFDSISTLIPCDATTNCVIKDVSVNSVTPGVDVGTPTIKVQDWGKASAPKVILFMHGFPHNHSIWVDQIKDLDKDKYRVVTMDVRGQGNSFKPLCQLPLCNPAVGQNAIAGYRSQDFANDVKKVISALNLSSTQKLYLVGHSYSGQVINDYIKAYGTSALKGIVYVASASIFQGPNTPACGNGAVFFGPGVLDNIGGMFSTDSAVNIASTKAFLDASVFNVWLNFYVYPKEPEILATNMMVSPEVRAALITRLNLDIAPLSVYQTINKPVLFIQGLNDTVILPGVVNCMASLMPSGTPKTLKFLNYTGHFPMFEQADQFNTALMNFIGN